jgi:pimeloyl-ACP methyl ester carboxylesterase
MQPRAPDSSAPALGAGAVDGREHRLGATGTIGRVTTLHVSELGTPDGHPVLALHGVTGHGERWRALADALPGIRLLAVDLRGHGYSTWLPPWRLEQHVADALAVLDERGLDRVDVFGHSFGGAIAVRLGRAAPERVHRLVLLDPAHGLDATDMLESAEETRADESFRTGPRRGPIGCSAGRASPTPWSTPSSPRT